MSAEEYARQVLKLELQANEELEDMVDEHSWEEVDDALVETGATLIERADSQKRTKTILVILFQIGQGIESERVVRFAKEHLEEWKAKYE